MSKFRECIKTVLFDEPVDNYGTYVCFGRQDCSQSHCASCASDNEDSYALEDLCCNHRKLTEKLEILFNKELARLTVEARSDELDKLIGNTLIPYTINIELIKEYVDNRSQALKSSLPEGEK